MRDGERDSERDRFGWLANETTSHRNGAPGPAQRDDSDEPMRRGLTVEVEALQEAPESKDAPVAINYFKRFKRSCVLSRSTKNDGGASAFLREGPRRRLVPTKTLGGTSESRPKVA
jgi:hypothetical protein